MDMPQNDYGDQCYHCQVCTTKRDVARKEIQLTKQSIGISCSVTQRFEAWMGREIPNEI